MSVSIKLGLVIIGLSISSITGMGIHDLLTVSQTKNRTGTRGRKEGRRKNKGTPEVQSRDVSS